MTQLYWLGGSLSPDALACRTLGISTDCSRWRGYGMQYCTLMPTLAPPWPIWMSHCLPKWTSSLICGRASHTDSSQSCWYLG